MFKKTILGLLSLGLLILACWYFWPAKQNEPERVVKQIQVGMLEDDVRVAMKSVALDSGTYYYGGTGNRRVYFELPQNRQLWVYCERASSGLWQVVEIGQIETKQNWLRHRGDCITVK